MVDNGHAVALMGNHEYNALCFHLQEREGGHVRKHLIKNIIQHFETLKQFQNLQKAYEEYLDWFKTLPLFFETQSFRAVHACWDQQNIELLRKVLVNDCLNDELIYESAATGTALNTAIDQTLKGKELPLPEGTNFLDKDGNKRSAIRIKWWEDPASMSYRSISIHQHEALPDRKIEASTSHEALPYPPDEKPVFFGHYWLNGEPMLYKSNVCCLDYSVANKGKLVAYRLEEGAPLQASNFVCV